MAGVGHGQEQEQKQKQQDDYREVGAVDDAFATVDDTPASVLVPTPATDPATAAASPTVTASAASQDSNDNLTSCSPFWPSVSARVCVYRSVCFLGEIYMLFKRIYWLYNANSGIYM